MMFLLLRNFRHAVHKIDGLGEIVELKSAFDVLLLELPFRDLFQAGFRLVCFQQVSHNGERVTSSTVFAMGNRAAFRIGQRPRILRKFFAESKVSTAQARASRERRGQSATTSFTAPAAVSRSCTKKKPLPDG